MNVVMTNMFIVTKQQIMCNMYKYMYFKLDKTIFNILYTILSNFMYILCTKFQIHHYVQVLIVNPS